MGSSGGIGIPACRQAGTYAAGEKNMITVYALSSINKNYVYVGQTNDLNRRFK
jgi:hypothetical protein